ncbi:UDP-glucose 4-epimerase GalE [Alphaproteobacteria bacterium]|nr:UDP-glucose 4-epimerase GalE [Alphaproteobacteria bacterium]
MRVLVTGGAGYIGSLTCLELLRLGHEVSVIDSLYSGSEEALTRVRQISNCTLDFNHCDVRDARAVNKVLDQFKPDAVVHFAGLKTVSESKAEPERYYDVNVSGTSTLLEAMDQSGCENIVFASSATVYGEPQYLPCDENHPLNPINPYGRTKLIGENLLQDWANAKQGKHAIALRYFNPVGADDGGLIGENSSGVPNNLMPLICQVAVGRREFLKVFGSDYETIDGTGVRDYIHVMDVVQAHILAVEKISTLEAFEVINIGTGEGQSVLQLVEEFERQSGRVVACQSVARRPGDTSAVWADATKAFNKLGFTAKRGLAEMCQDTWRWQRLNPTGYSVK